MQFIKENIIIFGEKIFLIWQVFLSTASNMQHEMLKQFFLHKKTHMVHQ